MPTPEIKIKLDLPRLTRGEQIGTTVICATTSALFIVPSWLSPWMDVAPVQLLAGLALPPAAALLFWSAKFAVDDHDARRSDRPHPSTRRAEAEVRLAEHARTVRVIEGEVLPRVGAR